MNLKSVVFEAELSVWVQDTRVNTVALRDLLSHRTRSLRLAHYPSLNLPTSTADESACWALLPGSPSPCTSIPSIVLIVAPPRVLLLRRADHTRARPSSRGLGHTLTVNRYTDHRTVENAGYAMADQQRVIDGTRAITEFSLGAAFGGLAHLHSREFQELRDAPGARNAWGVDERCPC